MSVNSCTFIGNVGKDPEVKTMNNGDKVANFSIACTEKWTDKNSGQKKEKTDWINIVCFGPVTKVVENWVKKGTKLYVRGKFTTRKWQDQSGNDRYSTEIVVQGFGGELQLLDAKGGGGEVSQTTTTNEGRQKDFHNADLDDEVPCIQW